MLYGQSITYFSHWLIEQGLPADLSSLTAGVTAPGAYGFAGSFNTLMLDRRDCCHQVCLGLLKGRGQAGAGPEAQRRSRVTRKLSLLGGGTAAEQLPSTVSAVGVGRHSRRLYLPP